MKKISLYIMALVSVSFWACTPDEPKELGIPNYDREQRIEGMSQVWSVENVSYTDLSIVDVNDPRRTEDVTELLDVASIEFSFTKDGEFTIQSVEGKTAPNFVGIESGTWSFDDAEFPTQVLLNPDEENTATIDLGTSPRPNQDMTISFKRMVGEDAIVEYTYELRK